MKLANLVLLGLASQSHAFNPSHKLSWVSSTAAPHLLNRHVVLTSSMGDDDKERADKIKKMMLEESMDPASMAATADRMKNMDPKEMDLLIGEIDNMDASQKEQLKAMGMDPAMMKMSMKMMRENPDIMKSAQKMMEKMTPEEMVKSSRLAQQQMAGMSPEQMEAAGAQMATAGSDPALIDAAVAQVKAVTGSGTGKADDPALVEAMFTAAEYMSKPQSGGVTLRAFATLGPIAALVGTQETDLTSAELVECWEAAVGKTGSDAKAARVDRKGFGVAWNEVRDYFEDDIMDEARDPNSSAARAGAALEDDQPAASGSTGTAAPSGMPIMSGMSASDMAKASDAMKSLKPEDLEAMMEQMANMGPEEEERLKAMGVNPGMMKKSVEMMKGNPMMLKAVQSMAGKISPEQMASAQKMAEGMSPEDLDKALKGMK